MSQRGYDTVSVTDLEERQRGTSGVLCLINPE